MTPDAGPRVTTPCGSGGPVRAVLLRLLLMAPPLGLLLLSMTEGWCH
jgi:hypothetical protein